MQNGLLQLMYLLDYYNIYTTYTQNINDTITESLYTLLDIPVLVSHCVAFMTDLNVGQIISDHNSLALEQI